MRETFKRYCKKWTDSNPSVIVLSDDYGYKFGDDLNPAQFISFGPMEQAIVGISAGLAITGKLPIVYAITPFIVERAFEQMKLDINQQQLKVMFVCYDDYPYDGPTHTALNPRVMVGLLNHFTYFEPLTFEDCEEALNVAYGLPNPSFIRLSKRYVNHQRNGNGKLCFYV